MATENKTKRNTDYSESAINLCNPASLYALLGELSHYQGNANEIQDKIDASIPSELITARDAIQEQIATVNKTIRETIDAQGSYQDVINGIYAVKQRRISKSYNADNFERAYPQFATTVIIKAIDAAKLKGLIKGGLVSEDDLRRELVLEETEAFAYIIKA